MFLKPAKLGEKEISESILSEDKKHCKKIGPCGIGKEALYLNSFYLERRFYIPVSSVSRVFKRVAMSKGGSTGKGLFATMPYLVVVYEDGKEKQCNFKYEDQVDAFVASVKERFPQIKTVSEAAEKRLAEAEKKQAEKCLIPLSEQAKETVNVLEQAKAALTKRLSLLEDNAVLQMARFIHGSHGGGGACIRRILLYESRCVCRILCPLWNGGDLSVLRSECHADEYE